MDEEVGECRRNNKIPEKQKLTKMFCKIIIEHRKENILEIH